MTEQTTIWTRVTGKTTKETVIVGRKISPEWLNGAALLTEVRLTGDLQRALADLIELGRKKKRFLPIIPLRAALIAGLDNIVSLDRDLGLVPLLNGARPCAMSLHAVDDDSRARMRESIAKYVRAWLLNTVEPWAEKNEFGTVAARAKSAVTRECIELADVSTPLLGAAKPNFPLIARLIADRLVGEELFKGMGDCELIARPDAAANTIELMTLPRRAAQGDDVFSMVARLTVCTLPYTTDIFLGVSAAKRVWSKRVPLASNRTLKRASAYVMSPGRPVTVVHVERNKEAWQFGDEYAAALMESGGALPATLEDAVAQREFDPKAEWWAGLPELTTLFKYVSPRTVFEADEVHLLEAIVPLLSNILFPRPVSFREVPVRKGPAKRRLEMLRLADLGYYGTAGGSLLGDDSDELEDDPTDDSAQPVTSDRVSTLQEYREQNREALRMQHGDTKPILWVLGNGPDELEIIERSVEQLFGDRVIVKSEPLPTNTHGLQADLDHGVKLKARERFDVRVQAWQQATTTIKAASGEHPPIAVICAADKYGTTQEDPVNYFAGIHAMSAIGANVHHLLPIEKADDPSSRQAFLHRTQSALLDVFLAHSGIVFGVRDFLAKHLPPESTPKAIYGVQALRSRARAFSGQTGVTMIVYTRLLVETGITEVQYVYRAGKQTRRTEWQTLSAALTWLGSQRSLHEGDERWLADSFAAQTKQTLVNVVEDDPHAFVLVDWASVAGLWRGIRDEDLRGGGVPALDGAQLATFPSLTFVRLRRGDATLSLRTEKKTTYEGWVEDTGRVRTGESQVDAYYTTEKSLAEIADDRNASQSHGHFIATMGYAKTVQVKRGFSCYRPMPRIQRLPGSLGEYQWKTLEPATMDAALPASMDITVLQTPGGVAPQSVALIVMGLRLGYAHYNDWTALPAPLFFRSKIEDYVIRFPEEDEADSAQERDAPAPEVHEAHEAEQPGPVAPAVAVDPQPTGGYDSTSESEPVECADELPDPPQAAPAHSDTEDLLARAKSIEMPVLFGSSDPKQRLLAQRVIQDDPAFRVRVDLPYWLPTRDIFGEYNATIRRNANRAWKTLRRFEYVSRNRSKMPREADFLNKLAERLHIPQAAHALAPACGDIGGLSFAPLNRLIHRYNEDRPPEERVNEELFTPESLGLLAHHAHESSDDEFLAWLVFLVAQHPARGWCGAVLEEITSIPGPLTLEALSYYVQTAFAVEQVLAQTHRQPRFTPVIVRRERPAPTPATVALSAGSEEFAQTEEPKEDLPGVPASALDSSLAEQDPVMPLKTKIIDIVNTLSPGHEGFPEALRRIEDSLREMESVHRKEQERNNAERRQALRFELLDERFADLMRQIEPHREALELSMLTYHRPQPEGLEEAEAAAGQLAEAFGDVLARQQHLEALERQPKPASLQERGKLSRLVSAAFDDITSATDAFRAILTRCSCLSISGTTGSPDKGVEAVLPPVVEPPLAVEAAAEALPSHETTDEPTHVPEIVPPAREPAPVPVVAQAEHPLKTREAPPSSAEAGPVPAITDASPTTDAVATAAEDEPTAEPSEIEMHASSLAALLRRRFYGLAAVHVEALEGMLARLRGAPGASEENVHYVLLRALVRSLDRMDCQFEFDARLDPHLKELLSASALNGDALCEPSMIALGVLAAGLSNMLFDSTDIQWSLGNAIETRLTGHAPIRALIAHIDLARHSGLAVTRDMFRASKIGDQQAVAQELKRLQTQARGWAQSSALFTNWHHTGFEKLHDMMFSPTGVFGQCLGYIAAGNVQGAQDAFEATRRRLDKPSTTVDDLFKKCGGRTKPDGKYRVRAIENVDLTRDFITTYLATAERLKSPATELSRQVQNFLRVLHEHLDAAREVVATMQASSQLEEIYRTSALTALDCALRLYSEDPPAVCIPQDKQRLLIQVPLNRDIMPALEGSLPGLPALCAPEAVLAETSRWANEDLSLRDDDEANIDAALQEAMRRHVLSNRFLPAFRIEALLARTRQSPGDSIAQHYARAKSSLAGELLRARQRVTHAMTLSAVPQAEASAMLRAIEEMSEALRPERGIGHFEGQSPIYHDFPHALAALRTKVTQPLDEHLQRATQDLRADLQAYADAYLEKHGVPATKDVQRVKAMLDAESPASLRTAHDALRILKQGHELPATLGSATNVADEYERFLQDIHRTIGGHANPLETLRNVLEHAPAESDPDWLKQIDDEQRAEGVQIIDTWIGLFSQHGRNLAHDVQPLADALKLLGISQTPSTFPEHGRRERMKFTLPERTFTFSMIHDSDVFVPPVLGSCATHIQGFMLYGAATDNDVRQTMSECGATPTVVLARMRLSMQRRVRVTGHNPALIVDDDLVAYIALHPGDRLQTLLRVAVLTFYNNPYDDYNSRPVPAEMFFGRHDELRQLHGVKSFGILYGGRRLGKSSLLSQIERETRMAPGSEAVYVSMEAVNASSPHLYAAWEAIYRALVSRRVIKTMTPAPGKWQQIRDWIETQLTANTSLKSIYLLIDEADALMGCELRLAKGEQSFVRSLQQMVDTLSHRLEARYVIAGLHNMARMTTEENSVFGKSSPIALEPFNSREDLQRGIQLITKPLAAMGFLFGPGSEDLPLHILSVCNFYPAFIQLYCKRLVDRLYNNRQENRPSQYIKRADLDAVEKDERLLDELREKFALNLNLDKRYKAIALILAELYHSKHDGGLDADEIRVLCEAGAGDHFRHTSPAAYEALLDEMRKLNVLERVGARYVLRNPHIAMMIGEPEVVNRKLRELAAEPAEESRSFGDRRISMQMGTAHTLFPYPVAWVRRHVAEDAEHDLLICPGNLLSGIEELVRINPKEDWRINQEGVVCMLQGQGPAAAGDFATRSRRVSLDQRDPRLVLVRPNCWTVDQIPDFVAAAAKAAKASVRFMLLATPERALELARAIDDGKITPKGGGVHITPVPTWTPDAIYFHLDENTPVAENAEAINALHQATMGFTKPVLDLCRPSLTLSAALKASESSKAVRCESRGALYAQIGLPATFRETRLRAAESFLDGVNGTQRGSSDPEEWRELTEVTVGEMAFLQWMGLLDEAPDGTWYVPKRFAELLKTGAA